MIYPKARFIKEIQELLTISTNFSVHRVAHAGGGINNTTYTNSIDALNANIKKGFTYFEIDFSFTKDERLVCLHDWHHSFQKFFGFKTNTKVTLEEFNTLVKSTSKYNICTIDSLALWMKNNPDAVIITDVKENNIKALKIIYKKIPNAKSRVIPQIYNPNNFREIKKIGFKKLIWTVYRFRGDNNSILSWVNTFSGPFAVTMPESKARSTLPKQLKKRKIPTYVHTINDPLKAQLYINKFGISEIYTDFLLPKK